MYVDVHGVPGRILAHRTSPHQVPVTQGKLCCFILSNRTCFLFPFHPLYTPITMASWIAQLFTCLALVSSSRSSPISSLAPRAVVVDDVSQLKPEYDYVVVGGGTSGLVVANRLTEDPSSTSLVYQLQSLKSNHVLRF